MSNAPQWCVVLAAGRGTRLKALTSHLPKPMIPLAGRPLLEHILIAIRDATPIRDFVVVVRYLAATVTRYFGDGTQLGIRIRYALQPDEQPGTAGAVRAALPEMPPQPFLMSFGDILTDPANYLRLLNAFQPGLAAVLGVNWLPDVSEGGGVWLDGEKVVRVQEKPRNADTNWNLAGVHLFSPVVAPVLLTLPPSARGEYELTDAIQVLLQQYPEGVRAVRFEGYWNDVGTPDRLQQAAHYLQDTVG